MNRTEHLLSILAEECAEVAHRVSKALRFGLEERQTGQHKTNAARIVDELLDLKAAVDMLEDEGALEAPSDEALLFAIATKRTNVEKYLRYSESLGVLNEEPPVTRDLQARMLGYRDAAHAEAEHHRASEITTNAEKGTPDHG